MIRLLGGSKCRYTGQGLKMAQGRAKGQPFLVQTRRTVTIILANPSVFGLIIGASQQTHRAPASLSASVAEASEVSRAAARQRLLRNPHARIDCADGFWKLASRALVPGRQWLLDIAYTTPLAKSARWSERGQRWANLSLQYGAAQRRRV